LIWLLPAAICSIGIALILKQSETRGGDRLLLVGANYITASLLAFLLVLPKLAMPNRATVMLGAVTGVDYVLGFLVLAAGIARGPLAVPVTVMRLSVAVPIMVSIALWAERPGGFQWAGIALGTVAIILFGYSLSGDRGRRGDGNGGYWMLIVALFLVMGAGDVLLKAFRELSPDSDRMTFTWILFTTAGLFAWLLIRLRRTPFDRRTFLLGLLLGVPNLFSTVFTLLALRSVPASIAFPFINLTVIAGSALFAFFIWRERLGRLSVAGLLLAAVALVLLPLG
jgi:drug/metabolite transporter (DMT)-like permease